jgi:ABC-type sulfate transport system substrate-binding protein
MLATIGACLPKPLSEGGGGINITLYGFSIMKEPLEKAVYPAFAAKAKREHNIDIHFNSSFAGSETVTNQNPSGRQAQVAILSIERGEIGEASGLCNFRLALAAAKGIVNKTPFVILGKGGQRHPRFQRLAKPGVKLVHPDPGVWRHAMVDSGDVWI